MSERLKTGGGNSSDDWNAVFRDHGVNGFGKVMNPVDMASGPIHPTSDAEAIQRDHGVGFGTIVNPVDMASGPIHPTSDAEAAQKEHGAGFGIPADPTEKYDTNDQELLDKLNGLRHANWASDLKTDIESLPPKAVSELISWRFKQSANALDDRYGDKKKLGEDMYFDLSIIAAAIDSGKDLPKMDVAQYLGQEDERGLSGVLDAYADKIKESGDDVALIDAHRKGEAPKEPLNALEVIATLKKVIDNPAEKEST